MQYLLIILFSFNFLIAELIKPENLDTLSKIHILFEWGQEPDAIEYNLQLSSFNDFSELLLDTTINNLLFIDKKNINWNSEYFWRVRPILNDDLESWIDTNLFFIKKPLFNDTGEIYITHSTIVNDDLIAYGDPFRKKTIIFDRNGREVWNDSEKQFVVYHVDEFGIFYGRDYPSGSFSSFNLNHDILWETPLGYNLNYHDFRQLPNENYIGLAKESRLGPIPIGDWSTSFQNLGYEADGITNEFEWLGYKIIEWDKETKEEIWTWDVFDYFSMNDYDIDGNTWNQALNANYYDWTHANSIHFDKELNFIFISNRTLSRITKIDYHTGEIVWNMGLSEDYNTGSNNICTNLGFSWQHHATILDNSNLLFFDNGNLSSIIHGYDDNISKIFEVKILDNHTCEIIFEYELPQSLFGMQMGSSQKLTNGNYLINTVGNHGNIIEVNPNSEIIWNAYLNNNNHDDGYGSNYRAYNIKSIHPEAFSVTAEHFMKNDNSNTIQVIDNQISFTIYNKSSYIQEYLYEFTDLNNQIFNNDQGNFTLNANESIILSFITNNNEIDITDIMLTITPIYHQYAEKQLVFNVSNFNLSNAIYINDTKLTSVYPNPFNPMTTISYEVLNLSNLEISIYNINGQLVEILEDRIHKPGQYNIIWNANAYTSGLYFIKLIAEDLVDTQKIILVK